MSNDMDSGALVISSEGDHVLYIQKAGTVIIPRFDINIPMEAPEDLRVMELEAAVVDRVEVLLKASMNLRADNRVEGTGSMPRVPDRMVVEELEAQLRPHKLKWLCAGGTMALAVAKKLEATVDGLEVLERWGALDRTIIGLAEPVGYRLPTGSHVVTGPEGGYEVTSMGWLIYPGRVAVVEVVF